MTEPAPGGSGDPAEPPGRTGSGVTPPRMTVSGSTRPSGAVDRCRRRGRSGMGCRARRRPGRVRPRATAPAGGGRRYAERRRRRSTDRTAPQPGRLRAAVSTMTNRMMSERAVRASEAARRGVRPAREAAQAAATGQAEAQGSHRRSAFHMGFFGGFGVLIAYVSYLVLDTIRDTLILIAIAMLLAIGLDPLVNLITKRGMRRGSGVAVVFLGLLVVIGAAIYAIIPPIVNEVGSFAASVPRSDHRSAEQRAASGTWTRSSGSWTRSGTPTSCRPWAAARPADLLTASATVPSVFVDLLIILVLTLYLLSGFPKIKAAGLPAGPGVPAGPGHRPGRQDR